MTVPEFKPGESLSAGKLNQLGKSIPPPIAGGPGLQVSGGRDGVQIRDTRYRRYMVARTGGAGYPASGDTITISTEFPFEFVDIDHDLTPIIKERSQAAFVCYNLTLTHIAEDTLIVVFEHRGKWYTQTGAASSGGGATSIWFTIDAVDCDESGTRYLTVTPTRIAPPCESVPGADSYGDVIVYDDGFGCILNEYTDDELVGLAGRATYASDVGGSCVVGWTLDGLCDTGSC